MEISLSVPEWLKLSHEARIALANIFAIPKSKGAQVEQMGSETIIQSDGYTHEDLKAVTIEKMQSYLGSGYTSDTGFVDLFHLVLKKIESKKPTLEAVEEPTLKDLALLEWAAIFSRIKGQAAEYGMEELLEVTIRQVFNIKKELNAEQKTTAKRGRPKKVK